MPSSPDPLTLNPVWTLIGVAGLPCDLTAEDLLQDATAQGGDCTELYRWNRATGLWEGHPIGLPFGNFAITDWEGYFVKCSAAMTYTPGAGGVCGP